MLIHLPRILLPALEQTIPRTHPLRAHRAALVPVADAPVDTLHILVERLPDHAQMAPLRRRLALLDKSVVFSPYVVRALGHLGVAGLVAGVQDQVERLDELPLVSPAEVVRTPLGYYFGVFGGGQGDLVDGETARDREVHGERDGGDGPVVALGVLVPAGGVLLGLVCGGLGVLVLKVGATVVDFEGEVAGEALQVSADPQDRPAVVQLLDCFLGWGGG